MKTVSVATALVTLVKLLEKLKQRILSVSQELHASQVS